MTSVSERILSLQVARDVGITTASFQHSERLVDPSRFKMSILGLKVSCGGA